MSVCLSVYLSVCLSVCPSVCLSVYLCACACVPVCVCVPVHLCTRVTHSSEAIENEARRWDVSFCVSMSTSSGERGSEKEKDHSKHHGQKVCESIESDIYVYV